MNGELFTGYILTGGKSSRMKTDKAFLEVGGKTLLERAVETLAFLFEKRVKIVLSRTQKNFIERLPENIPYIFDQYENRGALGGMHAAFSDCETKYALILAVDLPLVTAEVIENLIKFTLASNKYTAVVPRQIDGRFQPLCAAYLTRYCLPPLENLLNETANAPVQLFLDIITPRFIDQNKLAPDDSKDIFYNVNRPADFESIK